MSKYKGVDWLYNQIPNYQSQGLNAYKPGLERISKLAEQFQNPQNQFKSIHIAGTNGKGSTAHGLASILQEGGYKVALFTSPHLKNFTERFRINGRETSMEKVNYLLLKIKEIVKEPHSFFEITTLLAFLIFKQEQVDIAIIETGLGGRLDATNIILPLVSVITHIGWDHQEVLGHSLEEIATEKAGIIKKSTPLVLGDMNPIAKKAISNQAELLNAPTYLSNVISETYPMDLMGIYQSENQKTILTIIEVLQGLGYTLDKQAIEKGLLHIQRNTGLRGRWEVLGTHPFKVWDTAHNVEGLAAVIQQIELGDYVSRFMVIGFVQGKDIAAMIEILPKTGWYYLFSQPSNSRGIDPKEYEKYLSGLAYEIVPHVPDAYQKAQNLAQKTDAIVVTGSNFMIADLI